MIAPTVLATSWPPAGQPLPTLHSPQSDKTRRTSCPNHSARSLARISERGSCHLLKPHYLRLSGDEPRLRERYWDGTVPSVWEYCPGCTTAGRSDWEGYRSSNAARDVYGNSG